jgi:hypothetical protein
MTISYILSVLVAVVLMGATVVAIVAAANAFMSWK